MAEETKRYASGFVNTQDGNIYHYKDDDARALIAALEARIKALEELNMFIVEQEETTTEI